MLSVIEIYHETFEHMRFQTSISSLPEEQPSQNIKQGNAKRSGDRLHHSVVFQ